MTDDNEEWPTTSVCTDATSALEATGDSLWEFESSAEQSADLFESLSEMLDLATDSTANQTATPKGARAKKSDTTKDAKASSSSTKRKATSGAVEDDDNCFENLNLDGLGALRPSTSFNDFAHLLLPDCMDGAEDATSGIATLTTPVVVSSSSLATESGSNSIIKTTTKAKSSNSSKRSTKIQKTTSSSLPSSKKGSSASAAAIKIGAKSNQIENNSVSASLLPRFNGIGKKTTSNSSIQPNTSSTIANAVSLQSSPVATNSIVDLPKPAVAANSSSKQDSISVNDAVDSAVATAAAAAANLLKQHSNLDSESTPAEFSLGGSAATGYSFKDSGSSNSAGDTGQNGNSRNSTDSLSTSSSTVVNTSTDHINALTSSNWVAACNASGVANFTSGTGCSADSATNTEATVAPNASSVVSSSSVVIETAIVSSSSVAANTATPAVVGSASSVLTSAQQQAAAAAAQAAANKRRRQNLTADERAKQNRDRNREHARNTRLRKKAYVEELKRTLTELVHQRDAAELERKRIAQREVEQREVRFRVLEEFLKLRGGAKAAIAVNGATESKWCAILEEGFLLTLPVTSYREMVHSQLQDQSSSEFSQTKFVRQVTNTLLPINMDDTDTDNTNLGVMDSSTTSASTCNNVHTSSSTNESMEQVLTGVKEVMNDASLVLNLLKILGRSSSSNSASNGGEESTAKIYLSYRCDKSRMMMDGTNVVVPWIAQSVGAVKRGASDELYLKGSARANYNASSNKLRSVELMFDTGAVISQLSSAFPHFTSQAALEEFQHTTQNMSLLTEADAEALLDSINVPQIGMLGLGNSKSEEKNNSQYLHNVSSSEHSDSSTSSSDENDSSEKNDDKTKPRRSTRACRSSGTSVA